MVEGGSRGSKGERGGRDSGSLQCHPLLFLSEDQTPDSSCWVCPKLLAEAGCWRWAKLLGILQFKGQLRRKQIPLNSTFSFSLLLHCPKNIFHVFRQFQFFPVKKKFSPFLASPWSTNQQGVAKQNHEMYRSRDLILVGVWLYPVCTQHPGSLCPKKHRSAFLSVYKHSLNTGGIIFYLAF